MARSFILGGVAATGLATGRPFIKRITRISGAANVDRSLATPESPGRDGLTCTVIAAGDNAGSLSFATTADAAGTAVTDGKSKAWEAGELLFVEFPSTSRTLSVQLEDMYSDNGAGAAGGEIRLRVMLVAEGQVVKSGRTATPETHGNFIEIRNGETATISARTKGVFIKILKYDNANGIFHSDGGTAGNTLAGVAADKCQILVTAVLDNEPSSTAALNFSTGRFDVSGKATSALTKIWGDIDGVG